MNFLFSLIYAPLVFLSLRYFDIQTASSVIFILSLCWLFLLRNKRDHNLLFPLFYLIVAIVAYFSNAFLVLKALPLFIATSFSLFMLISYLQGKSLILYFAEKFSKMGISNKEKKYIHNSTLFWFVVSLINVLIHLTFFEEEELSFWLYYSSFGWYFLFLGAGLIQFLHRKYIFLRNTHV